MRLCDRDIEQHLEEGKIVIEPRPDSSRISGVSVDVLLGNEFRVFQAHTAPYIDLSGPKEEVSAAIDRVMSDEIYINDSDVFILHPGELALAVTHESVTLPDNIVGWLDGRSTLARFGLLVHVTAHRVDPGWNGKVVLEFYNAGAWPLRLQPGMKIGAMSFEEINGSVDIGYGDRTNATYQDQQSVVLPGGSR